jgi:type I restriction-modification system DNA methylase subunit
MKKGGIFDFDSKKLDFLLDEFGTKNSWINLLATHVSKKEEFGYILKDENFLDHRILEDDLLENLSIGEISVLYEYSMARLDSGSRKSNGQFFTPDDVARFMASYGPKFGNGIWLDPCSGIGNLSWHLVNIQKDPEEFLQNNMILSDKDSLALLIARCLFTLSFQRNNSNLFESIKGNFCRI